MAGLKSSARSTIEVATDEPPPFGFTAQPSLEREIALDKISGFLSAHAAASTSCAGETRRPASVPTSRVACLSMHRAEAPTPEPVKRREQVSRKPCTAPFSPSPPWSPMK